MKCTAHVPFLEPCMCHVTFFVQPLFLSTHFAQCKKKKKFTHYDSLPFMSKVKALLFPPIWFLTQIHVSGCFIATHDIIIDYLRGKNLRRRIETRKTSHVCSTWVHCTDVMSHRIRFMFTSWAISFIFTPRMENYWLFLTQKGIFSVSWHRYMAQHSLHLHKNTWMSVLCRIFNQKSQSLQSTNPQSFSLCVNKKGNNEKGNRLERGWVC